MQKKNKNKKSKSESFDWKFLLKKIGKILGWGLLSLAAFVLLVFAYVNFPVSKVTKPVPLGVTFSYRYAMDIGLDWKKTYEAMLDDLGVRKIRIPVYWDFVEKEPGKYDFSELDWQVDEASKRNAELILVVGHKVPRWPECFAPKWLENDELARNEAQLKFVQTVVERYKGKSAVKRWQVENEPFLNFGICGTIPPDLVDREIALVKSLDQTRPVMVTDSGELSLWVPAAKRADIFGTTMYREVYSSRKVFGQTLGHWRYPIGPNFFRLKLLLIKYFAGQKNAVVAELQGEPWVQGWTVHAPIETQLASMNADILKDNVEFAKKTGLQEIYIWGVEWWYWMKETQGNATVWQQARELFEENK